MTDRDVERTAPGTTGDRLGLRVRGRIALGLILLLAVILVGCGDDDNDVVIAPDGEPDEVVFALSTAGGFVVTDQESGGFPVLVVNGDGTVTRPAPTILIYPGPALPALERTQLTQSQLAAVRESGLFTGDPIDPGDPPVADAPVTTMVATVDGEQRSVEVHSLDGSPAPGVEGEAAEARDAALGLVEAVRDIIDDPALEWEVVEPDRLVVGSLPYDLTPDVDPGPPVSWPLDAELVAATGETQAGCVTLAGEQARIVVEVARDATEITRWEAGDQEYQLVFIPWYPQLNGCP